MHREALERHQVWIYLAAIAVGLLAGLQSPSSMQPLAPLLWPLLALLLFVTFVQVPLWHLRDAWRDRRFAAAMLLGNFIALPLLAWVLVSLLPPEPALRLGVLLVLLVPCTDWFISFSQLGGGDVPRALTITPVQLVLQLLLLPPAVWLMAGPEVTALAEPAVVVSALAIVGVPLALAAAAEWWFEHRPTATAAADDAGAVWRQRLAAWPVPLLALVVFLIAATQGPAAREAWPLLGTAGPVFVLFLALSVALARALTVWLRLPSAQGRTLACGFGTRNSFVVLPLALALPEGWEVASAVIVLQAMVELLGMVALLALMPRLFPADPRPG